MVCYNCGEQTPNDESIFCFNCNKRYMRSKGHMTVGLLVFSHLSYILEDSNMSDIRKSTERFSNRVKNYVKSLAL